MNRKYLIVKGKWDSYEDEFIIDKFHIVDEIPYPLGSDWVIKGIKDPKQLETAKLYTRKVYFWKNYEESKDFQKEIVEKYRDRKIQELIDEIKKKKLLEENGIEDDGWYTLEGLEENLSYYQKKKIEVKEIKCLNEKTKSYYYRNSIDHKDW